MINNSKLQVLETKKVKDGTDIKLEIATGKTKGAANVKISGPNNKLEYSITVNKVKNSENKHVSEIAEKVIKPFVEHSVRGGSNVDASNFFNDFGKKKQSHECTQCQKKFSLLKTLRKHQKSAHEKSDMEMNNHVTKIEANQGPIKIDLKSKVREVPEHIKTFLNARDVLFKVPSDGACGAHALAAHIFNREGYGNNLRKNINICLQNQWSFYKNKVSFPYTRSVGVKGRTVNFQNSGELFHFF